MRSVHVASEVIKESIESASGPLPPGFLVEFLLCDWRRYLVTIHRELGEDSEEWKDAIAASELILWSVAPKRDDREKLELTRSLDRIVASIKRGMRIAGMSPAAQEALLRELSEWHLGLLSKATGADGEADKRGKPLKPRDTVQLDVEDMSKRELLDMLDHADIQQITVEDR